MEQRTVGFGEAIKLAIAKNYCNFNGRSSRSEYWWFSLFIAILNVVILCGIFAVDGFAIVSPIIYLGLFLPSLGIAVRRLHDINRSGWAILIGLIPLVGAIILLVWVLKPSQEGENQYGPMPNCN